MKNLVLITIATLAINFSFAVKPNSVPFVITKSDTLYCTNVNEGWFNFKVKFENGYKMVIPNNDVLAFSKNGKMFRKMPQNPVNNLQQSIWMEFVGGNYGMQVYKPVNEFKNSNELVTYYVFEKDRFILTFTKETHSHLMKFLKIHEE